MQIGRISHRKGADVSVEAAGILRAAAAFNFELRIVGGVFPGYEEFVRQLELKIVELNLGDTVTISSFVDDPASAYQECDVVLVPSRVEPLGLVAIEAQLHGRPVIASDTGGLPEVVSPDSGDLVRVADPASLAASIAALYRAWPERVRSAAAVQQAEHQRNSSIRYQEEIRSLMRRCGA